MVDTDFLRTLEYQGFTARIKRLSDQIANSCRSYYTKSGLGIQQNWHLIFLLLKQEESLTVTDISSRLRYSHPAVIKIIQKMEKAGFVERFEDKADQRKQILKLTEKAHTYLPTFESEWAKIETALQSIIDKSFMTQLTILEDKLSERNLIDRCFGDFETCHTINKTSASSREFYIRRVSPLDVQVVALIEKLNTYQIDLYGIDKCHLESPESLKKNHAFMVGAYVDDKLVGIGGIKLQQNFAEVKRMYVDKSHRGLSIAGQILNHLESHARAHGQLNICLETGNKHDAALRFYEKSGYKRIVKYGDYLPNDVSVYLRKELELI